MMFRVSVFCVLLSLSTAYHAYDRLIPNGSQVPNPCTVARGKGSWSGVGHTTANGGATRNKFGTDFASALHVWTRAFCSSDSDSDGRTNGEELGDPRCVWAVGQTPEAQVTGHPGICEPMDDPKCQLANLDIVC